MKTTLAELLDPHYDHYGTVGERVLILQHLMASARKFREKGRWGESGPSEILNSHNGCTNSVNISWHSERRNCRTWEDHFSALGDTLLSALCSNLAICVRWRKVLNLSLQNVFQFKVRKLAYAGEEEKKLFSQFFALEKTRIDPPHSFNSCHRNINVIWRPQLEITHESVRLSVKLTDMTEIRQSKQCASCWDLDFLLNESCPPWSPYRESFVQFLQRSITFIKTRKSADSRNI